jgi:hypothetical protein
MLSSQQPQTTDANGEFPPKVIFHEYDVGLREVPCPISLTL